MTKNISFFLFLFVMVGLVCMSCEKEDLCHCRDLEDCIDGECVLKEGAYYLGGHGYTQSMYGNNLFLGYMENSVCLDTVLFHNHPYKQGPGSYGFEMYTSESQPLSYVQLSGEIVNESFYSLLGGPVCHLNGYERYLIFNFTVSQDTIEGQFIFVVFGEPSLRDTTDVTLYRL